MLFEQLSQTASRLPDRPAAVDHAHSLTFEQLRTAAVRLGHRIARASPDPDRPVAMLLPTSSAFAVAFYAIQSAGRTALPLNFMLAPNELAAVLADSTARLVLTSRAMQSFVDNLATGRDEGQHVGPAPQVVFLEDLLADTVDQPAQRAGKPIPDNHPAALIYTSGSTGRPKGVMLSPGNLLADAIGCIRVADMGPDERFFGALPLFHAFGLTALMVVPNVLGATAFYQARLQPRAALETIAGQRVTVMMAIPSIYAAILKAATASRSAATRSPHQAGTQGSAPGDAALSLPDLRLPICGGEPLSANLAERFEQAFGRPVLEGYGLTEASPVVSFSLPGMVRPGTVGRPLPNISVRIIDDSGRQCPPGEPGEVVISGPTVMLGYRNQPDATAAVKTADGGLRTGDLGVLDADGFLRIAGRIKDMIIVGGENVYPGEIERVLNSHPKVGRSACIGMDDDTRGQAVAAFVQPADPADMPDQADLRAFCRDRLAGYKVPRRFIVMPELPVGPTGKVLKRELK